MKKVGDESIVVGQPGRSVDEKLHLTLAWIILKECMKMLTARIVALISSSLGVGL